MTQKYEFKDIKDVDLSKLEDCKYYTVLIESSEESRWRGSEIKHYTAYIETILLPCSPTVETDKIREEFYNDFKDSMNGKGRIESHANTIFNFFLPKLSVSKEVEVSDEEIAHYWKRKNCTGHYLEGLIDGSKWMRDKQGIAPKEVEEKK